MHEVCAVLQLYDSLNDSAFWSQYSHLMLGAGHFVLSFMTYVSKQQLYWDKIYESCPKGLIKMQTEDDEIKLMQFYFIFLFSDLCNSL